ncbi:hypothetical protein Pyn_29280 [Prunus yedoensis var. nudiflora]|uniref:Uncharacterized protein n=1 Tax=Prunus yedoensis var. nudiflora TaxID=2094558 RepID=A0A314YEA8_PRUYE|nr:hypothetical protein Pyn_29280 [Prunus yedoensis var. nudiflora]
MRGKPKWAHILGPRQQICNWVPTWFTCKPKRGSTREENDEEFGEAESLQEHGNDNKEGQCFWGLI